MFANRLVGGLRVPCVALYIVVVLAIVAYGALLRRLGPGARDVLEKNIYSHPILQDVNGWTVLHFLFFGLLGVLFPGQYLQFFLVGYGWEVIETLIGQHPVRFRGRRLQLVGEADTDGNMTGAADAFWYGKESDVVADMFGYVLGSLAAERYWPNPLTQARA